MPEIPETKLVAFWIIGSLSIMFGAWIVGHLEKTIGVSNLSYGASIVISALLIMFGGLAWIAVSVTVAEEEEVVLSQHES